MYKTNVFNLINLSDVRLLEQPENNLESKYMQEIR